MVANVKNSRDTKPTGNADLIQQYSVIMENVLRSNFSELWDSGPDVLYIMMSTMGAESSYRIYHGSPGTPNHVTLPRTQPFAKRFWNSANIKNIENNGPSPTVLKNLTEGVSAKALMGTMGAYQIRGCSHFNTEIAKRANYVAILESNGILVNPGESPSAVFTNDITGATKSMVIGCMIMESKYSIFRAAGYNKIDSLYNALQAYVGKAGAKGILNESPEQRLADINNPNNAANKKLTALGITKQGRDGTMWKPTIQPDQKIQVASNTKTVGTTNNQAPGISGCIT